MACISLNGAYFSLSSTIIFKFVVWVVSTNFRQCLAKRAQLKIQPLMYAQQTLKSVNLFSALLHHYFWANSIFLHILPSPNDLYFMTWWRIFISHKHLYLKFQASVSLCIEENMLYVYLTQKDSSWNNFILFYVTIWTSYT